MRKQIDLEVFLHSKPAYPRLILADIVKLSILSSDIYDCHELALFVRNHQQPKTKPILAVGMGRMGQLSRITSPISLVTHDKIPYPSAPGQLTLAEVHRARHLIGQLPKRKFFILGDNIAHSLSPTLHNAAFEELGLPHHYSIHQSLKIDDSVRQLITQPDFGGASVTYPHKREVTNLLNLISSSAKKIGAVNTIVVQANKARRVLVGDNTDWRGIKRCIELSNIHIEVETAIIIGAGGAARAAIYAVQELGISEVLLVNRSRGRVEKITLDFPSLKFQIFDNIRSLPSAAANIIVACVPADESREEDIPDSIFSDVGVLVEMAYRPHTTALMKVARRHGGWKVLGGVDVLKEQAYAQFSLWTGRRAPESVMADALNAAMVTH
jgi:shikimate-5-dehydrogenase